MTGTPQASAGVDAVEVGWNDPDAVRLRADFDAEMAERYGGAVATTKTAAMDLSNVFAIDADAFVSCILVRVDGVAAAHGALFARPDLDALEIRKVVVDRTYRGRRLGHRLMAELEDRAFAHGAPRVVLDTGPRQPDAVALYERRGYRRIPVFEPYTVLPRAMCYEKRLDASRI